MTDNKFIEPFRHNNNLMLNKASLCGEKAELPRSKDALPKATSRNQFLTTDSRVMVPN